MIKDIFGSVDCWATGANCLEAQDREARNLTPLEKHRRTPPEGRRGVINVEKSQHIWDSPFLHSLYIFFCGSNLTFLIPLFIYVYRFSFFLNEIEGFVSSGKFLRKISESFYRVWYKASYLTCY